MVEIVTKVELVKTQLFNLFTLVDLLLQTSLLIEILPSLVPFLPVLLSHFFIFFLNQFSFGSDLLSYLDFLFLGIFGLENNHGPTDLDCVGCHRQDLHHVLDKD